MFKSHPQSRKDTTRRRKRYRQATKDWKQELIDKSSLTYICTSECRYRPKASMVLVYKQKFSDEQMQLLILNDETRSIDGEHYVCMPCRKTIKEGKCPPCNESEYKFMIDKLPIEFMTLSKLESHLLKLVIPFVRIAHIPGYGEFKVKGPMLTVEAEVQKTMVEKILPREQELIPVSFKRKFAYKGNYIEEMISKSKIQEYFNYFKRENPLFAEEELKLDKIDEWIKSVSAKDSEREEVDNDCESDSETEEVDKDCESDKFEDTELFASWNLEDLKQ